MWSKCSLAYMGLRNIFPFHAYGTNGYVRVQICTSIINTKQLHIATFTEVSNSNKFSKIKDCNHYVRHI